MKKWMKVAILYCSINAAIRLFSAIFDFEGNTWPLRLVITIVGLSATVYYWWKERNL